jgi:hypothetical protein
MGIIFGAYNYFRVTPINQRDNQTTTIAIFSPSYVMHLSRAANEDRFFHPFLLEEEVDMFDGENVFNPRITENLASAAAFII